MIPLTPTNAVHTALGAQPHGPVAELGKGISSSVTLAQIIPPRTRAFLILFRLPVYVASFRL
jgi:hypothetical protein